MIALTDGGVTMPFGQGRSGGGGSGGAGGRGRGRGDKKTGDKVQGQRRPMFRRRKVCKFCADKIDDINYKDAKLIGPSSRSAARFCRGGSRAPAPCTSEAADGDQARAPDRVNPVCHGLNVTD